MGNQNEERVDPSHRTSANVSLKEMRWPSFSVSTSTPSQSNSSAAGSAAAGGPPAPAADVRTTAARRAQMEEGAGFLPTLLGRMHCLVVDLGTGRALEKFLARSRVDGAALAAAMESRRWFLWAGNSGRPADIARPYGCRCGMRISMPRLPHVYLLRLGENFAFLTTRFQDILIVGMLVD